MIDHEEPPLLLLGACVRAAAFSAKRAGVAPLAGDLFADVDLQRCCPARRAVHYPRGLAQIAAEFPDAPWMYTGALENYPDLVDEITAGRPLYGNSGVVLHAVRNPFRVGNALDQAGLACPPLATDLATVPRDGSWLMKRTLSSSGAGILPWDCSARAAVVDITGVSTTSYLQKRIEGRPCSAVFVAAGGKAVFVGATEQLIGDSWRGNCWSGEPWRDNSSYRYAGSLGPLPLEKSLRSRFEQIGQCLAGEFQLVGLLGVDVILSADDVWPVEVNPRYTASIEVLERALGIHAVKMHIEACRDGRLANLISREAAAWCGKAVLYARSAVEISANLAKELVDQSGEVWPSLADLPAAGRQIRQNDPILTVLTSASSRDELLNRLREAMTRWERKIYES